LKQKRIIGRPWGRRYKGGWVIQPEDLLNCLKQGDAVEIGEIQLGTKNLINLVRLMEFPDQELLINSNGKLEVQNIARYIAEKDGQKQTKFRLPRNRHYFNLCNGAWLPKTIKALVVIKPKKF